MTQIGERSILRIRRIGAALFALVLLDISVYTGQFFRQFVTEPACLSIVRFELLLILLLDFRREVPTVHPLRGQQLQSVPLTPSFHFRLRGSAPLLLQWRQLVKLLLYRALLGSTDTSGGSREQRSSSATLVGRVHLWLPCRSRSSTLRRLLSEREVCFGRSASFALRCTRILRGVRAFADWSNCRLRQLLRRRGRLRGLDKCRGSHRRIFRRCGEQGEDLLCLKTRAPWMYDVCVSEGKPIREDVWCLLWGRGVAQTWRNSDVAPIRRDDFAVLEDFNQELDLLSTRRIFAARQQSTFLATTTTTTTPKNDTQRQRHVGRHGQTLYFPRHR